MPETGIEPVRCLAAKRRILSPLCLPISPLGHEYVARPVAEQGSYCKTDRLLGDGTDRSHEERQLSDQLGDGGERTKCKDYDGAEFHCQALFEDSEFLLDEFKAMLERTETLLHR